MNPKKCMTTLALHFQGGVFGAVDSRASQGSFDASETLSKVIQINSFQLGKLTGCAADC